MVAEIKKATTRYAPLFRHEYLNRGLRRLFPATTNCRKITGHTYASLLIAQGEHPKYIQSQLGHSSINVTMDIYGHLMETVNHKAASLLGKTVLGNIYAKAQSTIPIESKC